MKFFGISIISLMLSVSFGVSARDLTTEVVVDRNIVPVLREASRPTGFFPVIEFERTQPSDLQPVFFTSFSEISCDYNALAPLAVVDSASLRRGYVVGGYFPAADFGLSAGYRIIDKDKLTVNARLQFDTETYKPFKDNQENISSVTANIGADMAWQPFGSSRLDASLNYRFLREKSLFWKSQNVNAGDLSLHWTSVFKGFDYRASFGAGFEKSSAASLISEPFENDIISGLGQQDYRFDVDVRHAAGVSSFAGVRVDGCYVHTSPNAEATLEGYTDLTPYFRFKNRSVTLDVGVKLDFAKTVTPHKVSVMPDVHVNYTPYNILTLWADVTGGSIENPFRELRNQSIYQVFDHAFARTRVPVQLQGGINFGPIKGSSLGFYGGYAVADNQLMLASSFLEPLRPMNITGWVWGAKIVGQWRFIKATVDASFSPSKFNKAWIYNRDRAATVVDVSVSVNPLRQLDITVGYQFRGGRKAYSTSSDYLKLGCMSDLSAGASWKFNPKFSVFAHVDNILGRQFMVIAGQPSRKVCGLVGAAYKF